MSAAETQEGLAAAFPARPRTMGGLWEREVLGRVWRFFTSIRLALILILMIAAAVMAGTLIDQAPASVIANPAAYDSWLAAAHSKYGVWAGVFDFTQLFNVFHSLWFRILIGLLTANIIVCSANRWKGIWKTVFHTRTRMGDAFSGARSLQRRDDCADAGQHRCGACAQGSFPRPLPRGNPGGR